MRISCIMSLALLCACNGDVYVRDGVTDGDTFYLAPIAHTDPDPVLQSWVAYSLARSTCQLELGGDNPARQSSFACELRSREVLVDAWAEHRAENAEISDDYLDSLLAVREAGYLGQYTVEYLSRPGWRVPEQPGAEGFRAWQRRHLRRHRPETRLIGYWGWKPAPASPWSEAKD